MKTKGNTIFGFDIILNQDDVKKIVKGESIEINPNPFNSIWIKYEEE